MTNDWAAVSTAINHRMTELGVRQNELIARSRVSKSVVHEIRHNTTQRRRNARTLEALSAALGWHPHHLVAVLEGRSTPQAGDPVVMSDRDVAAGARTGSAGTDSRRPVPPGLSISQQVKMLVDLSRRPGQVHKHRTVEGQPPHATFVTLFVTVRATVTRSRNTSRKDPSRAVCWMRRAYGPRNRARPAGPLPQRDMPTARSTRPHSH